MTKIEIIQRPTCCTRLAPCSDACVDDWLDIEAAEKALTESGTKSLEDVPKELGI